MVPSLPAAGCDPRWNSTKGPTSRHLAWGLPWVGDTHKDPVQGWRTLGIV